MKQDKRNTVLVVDDDPFVRESVSALLDEYDYSTVVCRNAKEAMDRFQGNNIDMVLTDIKMPGMSGIDLLGRLHTLDPDVPVIIITAYSDLDLAIGAVKRGAFDYIPKPYKPEHLLHTINKAVKHNRLLQMEKNYKLILETNVRKKTQEIVQLSREVINRLVTVAEFRDTDTGAHISRIGLYSNKLAEHMNKPVDFIDSITYASPLHDIGKIGVPDSVLLKPGPLTKEEFAVMEAHTTMGEKMLSGSSHPVIQMGAVIALNHHERWDGTGYPKGIRGEDIPAEGRIVLICDQYDALMSKRPYKKALSHEEVCDIITKGDGRTMPHHFDPEVLAAFEETAQVFEEIFRTHED